MAVEMEIGAVVWVHLQWLLSSSTCAASDVAGIPKWSSLTDSYRYFWMFKFSRDGPMGVDPSHFDICSLPVAFLYLFTFHTLTWGPFPNPTHLGHPTVHAVFTHRLRLKKTHRPPQFWNFHVLHARHVGTSGWTVSINVSFPITTRCTRLTSKVKNCHRTYRLISKLYRLDRATA